MTIPRYHIFSGVDEDAAWIEAADRLGNAHDRMNKLAAAFPGHYFIFCAETAGIVATIDTSHIANSQSQEFIH